MEDKIINELIEANENSDLKKALDWYLYKCVLY